MSATILDMSMSLDGFIAGPNETVDNGLGDGGQCLHDWVMPRDASGAFIETELTGVNAEVFAEAMEPGAVVCGRGTIDPAGGWGDSDYVGSPVFVYARHLPGPGETRWTHATYVDDIVRAVDLAKAAAGDKSVRIMGAGTGQAAISAGLLDEIQIHLVPVLLGEGRRLFEHLGSEHFELDPVRMLEGDGALHLHYRLRR